MGAQTVLAERFVRRTQLGRDEYRKNFRQLDRETIDAVTSPEADAVTPLMGKVFLRLANAPEGHWEREGVLRFAGEEMGGEWVTAWQQLVSLIGVASATARKALRWMHDEGVIGYYAGKNGAGIRVFLNRASSSIGQRPEAGQKNLRLIRTSNGGPHTSAGDTPFSDSFAVSEVLETDLNPRAPKNGTRQTEVVKKLSDRHPTRSDHPPQGGCTGNTSQPPTQHRVEVPVGEIVSRLRVELEPSLKSAARQAAAREHERTREWLESRGLPKAARVAQREAYNVLRQHGVVGAANERARADLAVGRRERNPPAAEALAPGEVRELAESCVAMLEARGQAIDVTLAGMSAEAGGFLLPADAPKVRELAEAIARGGRKG